MALSAQSQLDDFTYAVTDSTRNGVKWNFLRTLDLRTGVYGDELVPLLSGSDLPEPPPNVGGNGSAAVAFDTKNNRLYYTPMFLDRLAYIDLRTLRNYIITDNFTGLMPKMSDQSNIITRMFIDDDGRGYALTNDGNHFITFATKPNGSITDLGSLVDGPGNNNISVHNACSSFGGDIVADNDGNLYLFTSGNYVFKITIATKLTQYLGSVTGLPDNFKISGAVVDRSGQNIVVVSSVDVSDIYNVDVKTLAATHVNANSPWQASDLANGFVLKTKRQPSISANAVVGNEGLNDNGIHLFPNPVTHGELKVSFSDKHEGVYLIKLLNAEGKSVLTKSLNLAGDRNIVLIDLPGIVTAGVYLVTVFDASKSPVYNGKIIVE